ncbi:hypothetical protein PQX77_002993 [Marasmius sp. AFHP31]|nr:hypothetical protein PQX77_002993 [Marasmius sp. AFHP31]
MTLASQMGQFMRTTLYQGSGTFYSNIPVGNPDCPLRRNDGGAAVSDAAVTTQSLSLLTLNSKNDDFTDILREVARRATGSIWNSADGVLDTQKVSLTTGDNTAQHSQRLVRSCFDFVRGDGASDLKAYLRTYLAVQYDALVKLATFPSGVPNLYGTGLRPESHIIPEAQIRAITILLGGVISSDNATSPNGPGTADAATSDTGRAPIGAIVGGVVGGILGLALVMVGCYYCLRRRRQTQPPPPTMDSYPTMTSPTTSSPISTLQPLRFRAFVKGAPPISPGVTQSTVSSSVSPPSESQSSGMHGATTAELVTMLNQRLRNERWNVNESPPEYHKNP